MKREEVPRRRLVNQHLLEPSLASAAAVVAALGAVQAQDYAGARWAIGQRGAGITAADIDAAMAEGSIIRTHVLRPTWHFVTRSDIRWMLELTAPRVRAAMAHAFRWNGLDDALFEKSRHAITRALADGQELTRGELGGVLARAKIVAAADERIAFIMMRAELDAVVSSGARRSKEFTYALFDARVPPATRVPRDEALAMLALRYFSSHGPATAKDFSWWSGLTLTDSRRAAAAAGDGLVHEMIDGSQYWFAAAMSARSNRTRSVQLLPAYDEYTVGYADRGVILERVGNRAIRLSRDPIFVNTIVVNGQVVGEWKRSITARRVAVALAMRSPVSAANRKMLLAAAARFAGFLGLPLAVTIA